MKHRNLKMFLSVTMALILSISTAACGSKSQSQQNASQSPATSSAQAGQKAQLKLWYTYTSAAKEGLADVISSYNSSQDKTEVVQEYVPSADLKRQLSVGLAAEKLPDITLIDNPDHAAYSAMGLFLDITDKVKGWDKLSTYYQGPLSSTIYNGKNYGLPMGSNCLALFYNKKIVEGSGVEIPKSWDDLRSAAKKLTKDGTYGYAMSAVKSEEGTFQFTPFLLSSGASFDKLNTPEAIKSLSFITDLIKDGSMSKEAINWTQADVQKQFISGKAAFMLNGSWCLNTIKKDAPDLDFGVALVPKDKEYASVLGGENIGIIANTKYKDQAWDFLKFTAEDKNMETFNTKASYFPPRKDVAENSAAVKNNPLMKIFIDQLGYAKPRGPHPKWPQISNAIFTAEQEAFTLQKTADQAFKDAQTKLDSILK
jgi:multiple sugar transport system substrate-binding protein